LNKQVDAEYHFSAGSESSNVNIRIGIMVIIAELYIINVKKTKVTRLSNLWTINYYVIKPANGITTIHY